MSKIFCFGDSWAYGAELKYGEKPFVHWLAQSLGKDYKNFGVLGSSLGVIVHDVIKNLNLISKDDMVFVVIPPDSRWYDQDGRGFFTLNIYDQEKYVAFLQNKSVEWFVYHHALFIYSLQQILNDIGCHYTFMLNYGNIEEIKKYNLKIDFDKFLSEQDLVTLLSRPHDWENYSIEYDGPPNEIFSGKYFEGCDAHPNQLGHQRIAELLLEKIKRDNA